MAVFKRPDREEMAPLDTARDSHSAVVLDGKIYVLGGDDGSQETASVERYRPQQKP